MNEDMIVTSFVVIDEIMAKFAHSSHPLAQVPDTEIILVGIVAARYFQNHQERTLQVMGRMGYLSGRISISRFNRRLHQLAEWLPRLLDILADLFASGELFIVDSLPLPVCKRVRAMRCKKVRGKAYCGYCASKKWHYFGWKLHLVCSESGFPVAFEMLPAAYHDLTPIHEITCHLPAASCVLGDKAYNSASDEQSIFEDIAVELVPRRRDNMARNRLHHACYLRYHRQTIETVYSQLEKMGIQRLHARTHSGFEIKVHASLLALACSKLF